MGGETKGFRGTHYHLFLHILVFYNHSARFHCLLGGQKKAPAAGRSKHVISYLGAEANMQRLCGRAKQAVNHAGSAAQERGVCKACALQDLRLAGIKACRIQGLQVLKPAGFTACRRRSLQ